MKFFLAFVLASSLLAGEVEINYAPKAGGKYLYSASLSIEQEASGIKQEIGAQAKIALEFQKSEEGFVEKYELTSLTSTPATAETLGIIGKIWEINVSTKNAEGPFGEIFSQIPVGKKLKEGEKFTTISQTSFPFLDIIVNTENKMTYILEKVRGKKLFFEFLSEITASSHYPILKEKMAESDITGNGKGTFIYNNAESIIEEAEMEFLLSSKTLSVKKDAPDMHLEISQKVFLQLKRIPR